VKKPTNHDAREKKERKAFFYKKNKIRENEEKSHQTVTTVERYLLDLRMGWKKVKRKRGVCLYLGIILHGHHFSFLFRPFFF